MMRFSAWLILGAFSSSLGQYVDDKDLSLAADAASKVSQYCAVRDGLDNDADAKKRIADRLKAVAGENVIQTALKDADDMSELGSLVIEKGQQELAMTAGPFVFMFLLYLLYVFYCCWLPCCVCCRCCRKERKCSMATKLLFGVLLCCISLALLVCCGLGYQGVNKSVEGFEAIPCAAAKSVDVGLNGKQPDGFMGLIKVLQLFNELDASLQDNSTFIESLTAKLGQTQQVTSAVTVATATMNMLSGMLGDVRNDQPSKDGASLDHKCSSCATLSGALGPVATQLEQGVAASLSSARAEVDKQLTGDSLAGLRTNIQSATQPMDQVKGMMHSLFGPFVTTDSIKGILDIMKGGVTPAAIYILVELLLVVFCGVFGVAFWAFREIVEDPEGPKINGNIHRCSGCSWCCGYWSMIFFFFMGGLLGLICYPAASMCVVFDDLTGKTLLDVAALAGMGNLTAGTQLGETMGLMVDKCLQQPQGHQEMLELVLTLDKNGSVTTMKDEIITKNVDMIDGQFNQLTSALDGGSISVSDQPEMTQLISTLQNAPIDAMMLPMDNLRSSSTYAKMVIDPSLAPFLGNSSLRCSDFTVPASMDGGGNTIGGVTKFADALSSKGSLSGSGCAKKASCGASDSACNEANVLMGHKQVLMSEAVFKCQKFVDDSGATCQVENMVEAAATTTTSAAATTSATNTAVATTSGAEPGTGPARRLSGYYSGDCMKIDGTMMKTETYDCTLAEFTSLVQSYDVKLQKVFSRLDTAAAATMSSISVDMKKLVSETFSDKLVTMNQRLTCNWLGEGYRGTIEGLCYGGVWGLSVVGAMYVASGSILLFLVILTYAVWKVAVDNITSAGQQVIDADSIVPASKAELD